MDGVAEVEAVIRPDEIEVFTLRQSMRLTWSEARALARLLQSALAEKEAIDAHR